MSQTGVARRGGRRLKVIQLAPVLAIVALICWAFASPLGSSPDDDFHLSSIWCAAGEKAKECQLVADEKKRAVPAAFATEPCFAHKAKESAACGETRIGDSQSSLVVTARGNFQNLYPPIYYVAMSSFVGADIEVSVILMRIASVLLFVGLTTLLYVLLPASRRPILVWGLVMSLVPLGLFLIASNNPSGWAIISAGTLWVSLLGYFESSGKRKAGLGLIATTSTVLGAGARADSAAYVVVAVIVVVLLTARLNRRWIISALLPLMLAFVAAAFYLSTQQSSVGTSGFSGYVDPSRSMSWLSLFTTNLLNVPSLWAGVFGSWGLGWLDTRMPAIVWVGGLCCFAALAFTGLASLFTRKFLALAAVVGALGFMPAYVLTQSGALVGEGVQPRYILPLIVMLGGIVILQVDGINLSLTRWQVVALMTTLATANAIALHFNIRRYVTGTDVTSWNLNDAVEWWWDIPVSPMAIWLLGSLSFVALLVIVARETTITPPPMATRPGEPAP